MISDIIEQITLGNVTKLYAADYTNIHKATAALLVQAYVCTDHY